MIGHTQNTWEKTVKNAKPLEERDDRPTTLSMILEQYC